MSIETTLDTLSHTLAVSVSPYHCIKEGRRQLEAASFHPLDLTGSWNLFPVKGYNVPVYDSSLMSFSIGQN